MTPTTNIYENLSQVPVSAGLRSAAKKEAPLTKGERKAHRILSKTAGDSFWACAIRNTLAGGSLADFRQLIRELKQAAEDSEVVMTSIIGEEGYETIMALPNR